MISKENLLELEPRRKIYSYISNNPGVYLREISRKTEIPKTTLNYHLKYLLKQNLISAKIENGYRRFFISNRLGQREREILNLLRQESTRCILIYSMWFQVFSLAELSKELEKKPPTIIFHLKKLKKIGLIEELPPNPNFKDGEWGINIKRERISSEILYSLSSYETLYRIYNMLIIHKDNLPDGDLINNLLHTLILQFVDNNETSKEDKSKRRLPQLVYKKVNNPDTGIDAVVEVFIEMFPNPICA